jgi:drug/metabolite transporter (DMT)-like permease
LGFWMTILGSLFMCVGSLGFAYALRNGGEVGLTTTLCALYPALTLLLSFFFLGEQMSIRKGFGMVLAMVSIYILSQK